MTEPKKDTRWKPGQSGNPKGRAALTDYEREALHLRKQAQPEAMRRLIAIALGKVKKAPMHVQVQALVKLLSDLDKAVQVEVSGPGGGPLEVTGEVQHAAPDAARLEAIARAILRSTFPRDGSGADAEDDEVDEAGADADPGGLPPPA